METPKQSPTENETAAQHKRPVRIDAYPSLPSFSARTTGRMDYVCQQGLQYL